MSKTKLPRFCPWTTWCFLRSKSPTWRRWALPLRWWWSGGGPKTVFAVLGGWSRWKKPTFFYNKKYFLKWDPQWDNTNIILSPSINHLGTMQPNKAYKSSELLISFQWAAAAAAAGRCWAPGCHCWSLRFCRPNSRQRAVGKWSTTSIFQASFGDRNYLTFWLYIYIYISLYIYIYIM